MLYLQLKSDPIIYYLFLRRKKIDFYKLLFHKLDVIATLFNFLHVYIPVFRATLVYC